MTSEVQKEKVSKEPSWLSGLLDMPWLALVINIARLGIRVLRGLSSEGVYEVLEYETTLELRDTKGRMATFKKHERVRYLQDHVIAYQDQGWGDGKILVNYRCTPGIPVDRYRSGYKTFVLISLRDVKNRGEVDEFNINWNIRNGFLQRRGFWATEVCHPTRWIKVQVIFPKSRPPLRTWVLERNLQRTLVLGENSRKQLPDGRWLVAWERSQPRLYEHYILNWEW